MRVSDSIIGEFGDWLKPSKIQKCRVLHHPFFPEGCPIGYFDGAEQNGVCGAGYIIRINNQEVIKGWMKAGIGTNTREKVLSLWALLSVAGRRGVRRIAVAGDSKIVIGWEKGESKL